MTDKNKEKIELISSHDSPWGKFLGITKTLDQKHDLPNGWHWILGFYYLHTKLNKLPVFNLEKIQAELDDTHWLKKTSGDELKELNDTLIKTNMDVLLQDLLGWLKNPEVIDVIDFSKLFFDKTVNFSHFIFPISVSFEQTEFFADEIFGMADFHGIAIFNKVKFHNKVFFNNAKFFLPVEFGDVIFSKEVYFSGAKFIGVNFIRATFFDIADFAQAVFNQIANFRRVGFSGLVRFDDAIFKGGTSFADTIFETHAPHFYSAKISEDITWDRVKFPSIKKDTNRDLVQKNKEAYENLSGHMEKMNKHDDQHLFFRQEMRCRRWLGNSFNHLIHGLYEWFADYGYGVGYALCWWVGHIALGVLVITFIAMCGGIRYHESLSCAISVSFANANPYAFFGFDSENLKECYKDFNMYAPILFAIIKVIQTIVGVGLLFLVLLTLRIRFRLK